MMKTPDENPKQTIDQFHLVVEASPNAIILVNTEGEIILVNERTKSLFGYKQEELMGQPIEILVPPSFRAQHRAYRDAFFSEPTARQMGAGRDLVGLRKDGSQIPVEIGLNPITTIEGTFVLVSILDITERKRAEAALTENEQRFRSLIENAPDGIVIFGSSGRIEYASPAAGRILGYSPGNMVNVDPAQITHPDDLPGLLLTLSELLQTPARTVTRHYRMQHKDGSWRWLESNISNFADVAGIKGLVSNFRDITERKEAAESLRQSEARYRSIVEDQIELIKRSKADGTILFVNQAYCRTFGTTPEESVGQNFLSLLGETEREIVKEKISRLSPDNPVEINVYQDVLPDGRVVWLRWTDRGIFDDSGRLLEVQGVGYDITERRQAEEKLRQSETQLHYVIDTVPEGVLLLAADGSIRLTNPVADKFLTIVAPERKRGRLTHLGQRPLNELLTSPPKGLWHDIVTNEYTFEAIARPVEISPDNAGWVLVLRDVTQERDIQQRVQQQERLAAVGQLAAGIAHDFNNVMSVITLYAQLISRTAETTSQTQERLRTIEHQAQRATDLIRQILDFSRQSVLERRPLDLLPFMRDLVQLLDRILPEHVQIGLTSAGEEFLIQADSSRIQQVMMNLAVNARDAMPEGGQFQIRLAHVQTERHQPLFVQEMPPGNWVEIQVADGGSGIPPELLPKIFEPFFTTKEVGQGTGLGLAQVYGIVQQHEGYIDVATKVGQGTTFTLYFPILATGESVAVMHDNASLQKGQGQTVLVVEDDPITRQALVGSLVFLNYEVIESTNGREALTILLTTRPYEIDLVLSDAVMPEMGGIALLHAMKQHNLAIPIVLLTGHPLSKELEDLQTLNLAGWLPKPPNLANLSRVLAQALSV